MRILYIDIDSLRADHLGCYGYHRRTSQNIDRIAAEGVRFTNTYCSDAPCLPSRTALTTGRFGIHTGVVGHGGTCADLRLDGPRRRGQSSLSTSSLPAFLKGRGLHTTYIGGFGERHATFTFYAGFREIHDTGKGGMESAEDVTPAALEWIQRRGASDDWFLHVNYWDPHTPYRAPASFGNPVAGQALPAWYTPELIDAQRLMAGPHTAQDLNMYDNGTNPAYPRALGEIRDLDDLRRHIDGYDCGIAYADQHVGQLLAALEASGVLEDTAVIVSADHSENQGELGIYAEHATADQGTCRIPLIMRWPGGKQGHVDNGLHYHLDLAPTLADLLGAAPHPLWEGTSYAPAVLAGQVCGREELVLGQCAHVCQRSVRWAQWLYLRTYHDGFHLFPEEMLFDISADPHELRDLAPARQAVCAEARERLAAWHRGMMASMPPGYSQDPLQIVLAEGGPVHARGRLRDYCERLRATGRAGAIPELQRRHPGEFV